MLSALWLLQEAVQRAAQIIQASCEGVLAWLEQLRGEAAAGSMKEVVQRAVLQLEETAWLTPPMLTPRRSKDTPGKETPALNFD